MPSAYTWVSIAGFRGGRNNADDPMDLDEEQVRTAENGDWHRTSGFRKRGGATAPSIGSDLTGVIRQLLAHTPANNPGLAELFAIDDTATRRMARMAAASTFTQLTLEDAIDTGLLSPSEVHGASFEGMFFLAYNSDEDRMHVWDPDLSSPKVRRMGLATPTVPTVADTGSGSYAATIRYYRTRSRIKNGSTVKAQSEPSVSVSFTPSASGTHARVTYVTTTDDGDVTHWVLEASDDDVTFYEVPSGETAIGSLTFDDNTAVSAYSDGVISPTIGSFIPPVSWQYVRVAFNRLFGFGSHETGQPRSRLWFTTAKGASDPARGDAERVPRTANTKNERDLDEGTGGDATGLIGPVNGSLYAFKYRQIWKIIPTGVPGNPLDIINISKTHGATNQDAITEGLDADGRSVIYFTDPQVGPSILGASGPVALSRGIRDLWDGPTATVQLAALIRVATCVFYPDKGNKGQVWWWWATGSDDEPNVLGMFDIEGQGWSVSTAGGKIRTAACAVMFGNTLGSTMGRKLVPYTSVAEVVNKLLRADTTDTDDDGTTFQAVLKTRPYLLNEGNTISISTPVLLAKAASGVTLTVKYILDFGRATKTATVNLTLTSEESAGGATHVFRRLADLESGEQARVIELEVGDASAVANAWNISRFFVPVRKEQAGP
ncbi:hypothetical protein LCGC14_1330690 [marine sediment metagenome]|uniref:Uncharacterized protein n=1 Tax=marine sediment metagenome TaxID=412755 RepID=A0A0F9MXJ3_9ZZZZ